MTLTHSEIAPKPQLNEKSPNPIKKIITTTRSEISPTNKKYYDYSTVTNPPKPQLGKISTNLIKKQWFQPGQKSPKPETGKKIQQSNKKNHDLKKSTSNPSWIWKAPSETQNLKNTETR